MSRHELESVETELRQLKPARAPEAFVTRLQEAVRNEWSGSPIPAEVNRGEAALPTWRNWLKWLAPVTGAAAIIALLLLLRENPDPAPSPIALAAEPQIIDEVELDKQLIAAFEGVAEMPGGLPMRFRCYGWQEALTIRNASGAIEVEQRGPRLEIVPVGFDVY